MKIEIKCATCNHFFSRGIAEHNRSIKLNRAEYCSRSCSGKTNVIKNFGDKANKDASYLDPSNKRDEYTPFRYYVRKARDRKPESTITVQELKDIWNAQEGKCNYTEIKLVHCQSKEAKEVKPWEVASLDRINCKLPYNKNNVQFLSVSINYLKQQMTDENTRELIELIKLS